jgi:HK97 family phage prohead protease
MSLEFRQAADGLNVYGVASKTAVPYEMGAYSEIVERGAFRSTLSQRPDVVLRIEHMPAPVLARTTAGSLRLSEDADGLRYDATLDEQDRDAQDASRKVRAGLLSESSFAFRVTRQKWNDDYTERRIQEVDLNRGDVSLCAYGASPTTTSTMRAAEMSFEQRRAVAGQIGEAFGPFVFRAGLLAPSIAVPATEARAGKYTQAQIDALGRQGKAFRNPDGHYSFPINDRQDVLAAIHSTGRSGLTNKAPLRRFIIARAKALNASRLIPANWNADGTTRSQHAAAELSYRTSALYLDELAVALHFPQSPLATEIIRRSRRPRPTHGAMADPRLLRARRAGQLAELEYLALRRP